MHTELRLYRLSRTHQRDLVYQTVGAFGPLSIRDIALQLAGRVSERTVYRIIDRFLSAQIVYRPGHKLIDLSPPYRQERHFIVCRGCGRQGGFLDDAITSRLERIMNDRRFVMPARQIQLSGFCELCAQQI